MQDRDALSSTQKPPSGNRRKMSSCAGCERLIIIEQALDNIVERTEKLEARAHELEISVAEMTGRVLAAVESIPVVIKTALSVHSAMEAGHDIETKTPPPPAGNARLSTKWGKVEGSQRWLAILVISLGVIAAAAWIAVSWGPPNHHQQTSGAPPK